MRRMLVVCGYSSLGETTIHPICAARVRAAQRRARKAAVIFLSGASKSDGVSEAELMRLAWGEDTEKLVSDSAARLTAENAVYALWFAATEKDPIRVEVLTSWWHTPRAWLIFSCVFWGSGVPLRVRSCRSEGGFGHLLPELRGLRRVPAQVRAARALTKGIELARESEAEKRDGSCL